MAAGWLAEQMNVPLLVRWASDLKSMYVGENEKNIARAFKQAKQDSALLLTDGVEFDFLKTEQACELLTRYCRPLTCPRRFRQSWSSWRACKN
jgi:hypothetical protein